MIPIMFSINEGLKIIERIMPPPTTIAVIKIGARIFQVIPLTIKTPAMIAQSTSVVPKSFCSRMSNIGTIERPIIFNRSLKSVSMDLLKVNLWCRVINFANARIKMIFINSEG